MAVPEGERNRREFLRRLRVKARRGAEWFGKAFFAGLTIAATLTTVLAAYWSVARSGWGSDAAAWVQAAGSIVAIAGAAWIARGEARETRRWRREQGEEAAWAVRFVIMQAQFDSQIVAAELTKDAQKIDALSVRSWQQRAANLSLALQAMLARTDYLHAGIVLSATNAKVLVDGLSVDLEALKGIVAKKRAPSEQLISDILFVHRNLAVLLEQFDARLRGLRIALDKGRDMLPLAEWSVWAKESEKE